MLAETNCKRCGKRIVTMTQPIHSSAATMAKWSGICSSCVTDAERIEMMMDMNNDVKSRCFSGFDKN